MGVLRSGWLPGGAFDCCVVGAGPVGLAFAMEAAETGARVLLIESGSATSGRRDVSPRDGERTEIVDPERHAPLHLTTRRGVGGTSWLWGGRCVTFEPIDFEARDFVPGGAWPIGPGDVAPYAEAAARHLDCGAPVFAADAPDWPGLNEVRMSNLERWSRRPKLGPRLGERVLRHPNITVLLNATVTDIEFAERHGETIASLVVERDVDGRPSGERLPIRAASFVLAMGGVEVTRLLLRVQRRHPGAFGGVDGPLGRYYMGHATGSVADIVLDDPARAADLDFVRDAHDTYVRRRFTLSPQAQRRHGVLNTSFYLDNPDFFRADHRNPTLSAVFLGIAIPPVGRAILAEGIRLRHVGPRPYAVRAHVANVLRAPWRALADVADIIRRRYVSSVRKPGFLLRSAEGRYALHYHGEQLPHPDSRLTLHRTDAGDELLRIDFRYRDEDVESVLRSHALLDAELRGAGLGRIEYASTGDDRVRGDIWKQTTDGFHSIGTTRMGADPADSVVDADCRVHGVGNLYIASTSVLRTSAEANPTFFAAALAVRLAHRLARRSTQLRSGAVVEKTQAWGLGR